MSRLYYTYLGPEILAGFDNYKYSAKDTSPLSKYIMHPFWNQAVKLCPLWVAPNLLTLVGFLCCVAHFLLLTVYDYDFTAATTGNEHPIPRWAWLAVAALLFLSHTLDGIDGKQARRTGTSSPIGELFDHGLDSWVAVFVTGSVYHVFGRNDDSMSIPVVRMYAILWTVHFVFLVTHWEKYNTGVLYLPWGYDFSMVGGVVLYLITAVGGHHMWKIKLPGDVDPGRIIEIALYLGIVGLAIPISLYNIWMSYKEGTGKMRSFVEANRPLVSITLAIIVSFVWVVNSKNNILEEDFTCFLYMSGTVFAYISVKLIIAQMSNTRSELISAALYPLTLAMAAALISSPSKKVELAILYILTGVITVMHLHYGCCVVSEMCDHFNVRPFHIRREEEIRLNDNNEDRARKMVGNASPNSKKAK